MRRDAGLFGVRLKALREAAGFTQEELAAIAGLSVHAVSALERGERRRPQLETLRALSTALDLTAATRDTFIASARTPVSDTVIDELSATSLPLPLTPLLGRERDVQLLQAWLADPDTRLITLVGPGGVGKTRLMLDVAHTLAEDGVFRLAVAWLAALRDAAFVASAVAEALGLADLSVSDLASRAREACERQRPTLLVLDNFEQVLDAAPLVADLLTSVAALKILITSRAPLHIRGEREYTVNPLALDRDADRMAAPILVRVPAVRLFVERVRDVQPDFQLTAANGPTIAAICRRLDALPLALELAAPWTKALTVEGLLERLDRNVLFSTSGPRDLPERQQTMNATVAWSYQLLAASEQRAFRRFAVLSGPFSIAAAEAVLGDRPAVSVSSQELLSVMAGLMDKRLLVRLDGLASSRPLYQMLETVRAYAYRKLTAAGEDDAAMEGLVRYCVGEASRAAEGLVGPEQVEWLHRIDESIAHYRDVMAWLTERNRPAEAADVAWGLLSFWMIRGHITEALDWYGRIRQLPSVPPVAERRAAVGSAMLWYTRGELDRARTELEGTVALARHTDDTTVVALSELLLGHVEYASGNVSIARDWFNHGLESFRALGVPWGIGNALTGLAGADLAAGDLERAERMLDEATTVLHQAGPWYLTLALYVRAVIAVRCGNPDAAIAVVAESLKRIREVQDKFAFVHAMVPLAAAAVMKGDDAWAARILAARDAVVEHAGVKVLDQAVRDIREQTERGVRQRLGTDGWTLAYAAGRNTSIDGLLRDIEGALGMSTPGPD